MTKAPILGRLAQPFSVWMLAAGGGAALTVLTLLLFYLGGGLTWIAPPVIIASEQLQLVSGQGAKTAVGLEIRQSGPQGLAVIQAGLRGRERIAIAIFPGGSAGWSRAANCGWCGKPLPSLGPPGNACCRPLIPTAGCWT
ncbi:MAG: hypothetical protein HC889_03385 [Synechococcaceae cyanobacterium SM1_2_3]|nr:hypothetical protein [Synechococcaceae cyanobacterium SM1_2_3]